MKRHRDKEAKGLRDQGSRYRLTDTMVTVRSLADVDSIVSLLGLIKGNEGDGWAMYQDPMSGQQVVFTDESFGATWALAFQSDEIAASTQLLEPFGYTVTQKSDKADPFQYALYESPRGPNVLVYVA